MTMCAIPGCDEHYGCRLRNKGLQVAPSATPSRVSNRHQPKRPMQTDPYRQAPTGETRRDGKMMPYLRADGTLIRQGSMDRDRRRLEGIRRRQLAATQAQKES